jgi:hypothetical protein
MARDEDVSDAPMTVVCPNCMGQNPPAAHLCLRCMAPLDSFAATDPMLSIMSRYDTLGKASRRPANGVVLAGMWLIMGLPATILLVGVVMNVWEAVGSMAYLDVAGEALIRAAVCAVLALIPTILVVRTTRSFIRNRFADARGRVPGAFPVAEEEEASLDDESPAEEEAGERRDEEE